MENSEEQNNEDPVESQSDLLHREKYALRIAKEIREYFDSPKDDRNGFVFAVSGKWGEGKTHFLNQLKPHLEEHGYQVACFNPWQYSLEGLSVAKQFLKGANESLESGVNLDDFYFDSTNTDLDFNKFKSYWKSFWDSTWTWIILIAIGIFLVIYIDASSYTASDLFRVFLALLKHPLFTGIFITGLVAAGLVVAKTERRTASIATAEEFGERFDTILQNRKNKKPVVFFIDDLDRCTPKTVKLILDSLRTFWQHSDCCYVLTGDNTVIEKYAAIEIKSSDGERTSLMEGRRFLEKIFDVYWSLPVPTELDTKKLIERELEKQNIKTSAISKPNLIQLLLDFDLFERNPRHIKRFIKKLQFTLESVIIHQEITQKELKDKETAISIEDVLERPDLEAKVLAIAEFANPVYQKLVLAPEAIIDHEKMILNNLNPPVVELKIQGKGITEIIKRALSPFSANANLDEEVDIVVDNYIKLVRVQPRFMVFKENVAEVVFEPHIFFSLSASTGHPSQTGPTDETVSDLILKDGFNSQIGDMIKGTKPERQKKFANHAITQLKQAVETEDWQTATTIINNFFIATTQQNLSSWLEKIYDVITYIDSLPDEFKNQLDGALLEFMINIKPEVMENVLELHSGLESKLWTRLESDEIKIEGELEIALNALIFDDIPEESWPYWKHAEILISKSLKGIKHLFEYLDKSEDTFKTRKDALTALYGSDPELVDSKVAQYLREAINAFWRQGEKLSESVSQREEMTRLGLWPLLITTVVKLADAGDDIKLIVALIQQIDVPTEKLETIIANWSQSPKIAGQLIDIPIDTWRSLFSRRNQVNLFGVLTKMFCDPELDDDAREKVAKLLNRDSGLWIIDRKFKRVKQSFKSLEEQTKGKRHKKVKNLAKGIIVSWK